MSAPQAMLPDSNVARVAIAWGADAPRWVKILAAACDRTSQRGAAAKIGRTSATVSKIVNRRYAGSYEEAEKLVLAAFTADVIECPAFGKMALAACIRGRRRTGPAINLLHRQFAAHCPRCPNNTDIEEG